MAGIIVGIVALPLAIAFGIASGVSPEKGIVTAIIAGFLVSLLGGSRVQIGGPTGAFIVIVYGVIQQYGEAGLIAATLMAGVILVLLGAFKLGAVIKFIPYPIIVGFTSGIAVTIFTTQVADIFGLKFGGETVPGDFIGKWMLYFRHFDTVDWWNTAVSLASIPDTPVLQEDSRLAGGHHPCHRGRMADEDLRRHRRHRHHRRPLQHPRRTARCGHSRPGLGGGEEPLPRGADHRRAGRHRVAALGHRGRRRDGRPA